MSREPTNMKKTCTRWKGDHHRGATGTHLYDGPSDQGLETSLRWRFPWTSTRPSQPRLARRWPTRRTRKHTTRRPALLPPAPPWHWSYALGTAHRKRCSLGCWSHTQVTDHEKRVLLCFAARRGQPRTTTGCASLSLPLSTTRIRPGHSSRAAATLDTTADPAPSVMLS